jgi:hypothetical protein
MNKIIMGKVFKLTPSFILILIILSFMLKGALADVLAREIGENDATPVSKNIGFMENPSKDLKEKFPMCDAFLKVEWIDKEKKIGYSHYDLYKNGKKDGQMTALVYLNQYYPHFNYDLNNYRRKGELKSIISFIKKGEIIGKDHLLTIRSEKKKITFFPHTPNGASFSDNNQNVCIPYPDDQQMWIAESRNVGKVFTNQQIKKKYERLQTLFPSMSLLRFKEMNVIDLNNDGSDDYYFYFPWLSYSHKDQYFEIEKSGAGYNYIELYFPHSKNKCKIQPHGLDYLTTDGKNYFLSNQCNLTELTKGGAHHE